MFVIDIVDVLVFGCDGVVVVLIECSCIDVVVLFGCLFVLLVYGGGVLVLMLLFGDV